MPKLNRVTSKKLKYITKRKSKEIHLSSTFFNVLFHLFFSIFSSPNCSCLWFLLYSLFSSFDLGFFSFFLVLVLFSLVHFFVDGMVYPSSNSQSNYLLVSVCLCLIFSLLNILLGCLIVVLFYVWFVFCWRMSLIDWICGGFGFIDKW